MPMPASPLQYYHRYHRALETEEIYGEPWLRLTYDNAVGRFFLWLAVKRMLFSKLYGWQMNKRHSAHKILPFILKYKLDETEFAKSAFAYKSFNEFFSRRLKPEARPISGDASVAIFPADGRHLVFPDVDAAEGFYVKGRKFSLVSLFGEEELPQEQRRLSALFAGGAMTISRLCPVDYHRFHFPCEGVPSEPRLIEGDLYSVNPIALRRQVDYLVSNKRVVTTLETPVFDTVACIEVGATNVGSILQTFVPGRRVGKGEEKGLFKFGGSCVITLFQRGRIVFDPDLVDQSRRHIETYARMGDRLGGAVTAAQ